MVGAPATTSELPGRGQCIGLRQIGRTFENLLKGVGKNPDNCQPWQEALKLQKGKEQAGR